MTQEEKELLTKDIFDRVLTGLKVDYNGQTFTLGYNLYLEDGNVAFESYPMKFYLEKIETIKPYLRPLSSMTEEERNEISKKLNYEFYVDDEGALCAEDDRHRVRVDLIEIYIEWLNAHHFDYRELIEKGLALEAKDWMYKTKQDESNNQIKSVQD